MRIRYQTESADIAALWQHSFQGAYGVWLYRIDVVVLIAAITLGAPLGIWLLHLDGAEIGIAIVSVSTSIALTSLLFWFLIRPHLNHFLMRLLERYSVTMLAGINLNGAVGNHELTCKDEGLQGASDASEATYFWHAIDSVQSTDKHAFVYLNSISAIVIPRDSVTDGSLEDFIEEVSHRIAKN